MYHKGLSAHYFPTANSPFPVLLVKSSVIGGDTIIEEEQNHNFVIEKFIQQKVAQDLYKKYLNWTPKVVFKNRPLISVDSLIEDNNPLYFQKDNYEKEWLPDRPFVNRIDKLITVDQESNDFSLVHLQTTTPLLSITYNNKIEVIATTSETTYNDSSIFKNDVELNSFLKKSDVFFMVFLISISLFAVIRIFSFRYVLDMFSSLMDSHVARKMLNDKNVRNIYVSNILLVIFWFNLSLFVLILQEHFGSYIVPSNTFLSYLSNLGIIGSIYLFKILSINSIGFISGDRHTSKEYLYNVFLFNKSMALVLFPFLLTIPYVNPSIGNILIYISIFVVGFLYILRTFRGIRIMFEKHYPFFYLILYLCSLEILPILILWRYLQTF